VHTPTFSLESRFRNLDEPLSLTLALIDGEIDDDIGNVGQLMKPTGSVIGTPSRIVLPFHDEKEVCAALTRAIEDRH
jgi:hypothetical protein